MFIFKWFGWVIGGILVVLALLVVVALGAAGGSYWYWSRHADIEGTITVPVEDGEDITITLVGDSGLSEQEQQQLLEQSTITGQFDMFLGPFNWKLTGLRIGVDIPIEELAERIGEQFTGEAAK